jgi:hypothetical protein
VFPYFTNIPTDVWTNTWHFFPMTPMSMQAAADLVTPLLSAFYDSVYTESGGMANYCTSIGQHVNWYDLDQPPPRVPYTLPLSITVPSTATTLPPETSICLSFQALAESGQPQARRRGRIYLGGLPNAVISASVGASAFPIVNGAFRTAIGGYADTLKNAAITAGVRWSVYSPTTQESHFVDNGWIDNAPDTQRRRGQAPSFRTLWS